MTASLKFCSGRNSGSHGRYAAHHAASHFMSRNSAAILGADTPRTARSLHARQHQISTATMLSKQTGLGWRLPQRNTAAFSLFVLLAFESHSCFAAADEGPVYFCLDTCFNATEPNLQLGVSYMYADARCEKGGVGCREDIEGGLCRFCRTKPPFKQTGTNAQCPDCVYQYYGLSGAPGCSYGPNDAEAVCYPPPMPSPLPPSPNPPQLPPPNLPAPMPRPPPPPRPHPPPKCSPPPFWSAPAPAPIDDYLDSSNYHDSGDNSELVLPVSPAPPPAKDPVQSGSGSSVLAGALLLVGVTLLALFGVCFSNRKCLIQLLSSENGDSGVGEVVSALGARGNMELVHKKDMLGTEPTNWGGPKAAVFKISKGARVRQQEDTTELVEAVDEADPSAAANTEDTPKGGREKSKTKRQASVEKSKLLSPADDAAEHN